MKKAMKTIKKYILNKKAKTYKKFPFKGSSEKKSEKKCK